MRAVRMLQSAAIGLAIFLVACGEESDPASGSDTSTDSSTATATLSPPVATGTPAAETPSAGGASAANTPAASGTTGTSATATATAASFTASVESVSGQWNISYEMSDGSIRTLPSCLVNRDRSFTCFPPDAGMNGVWDLDGTTITIKCEPRPDGLSGCPRGAERTSTWTGTLSPDGMTVDGTTSDGKPWGGVHLETGNTGNVLVPISTPPSSTPTPRMLPSEEEAAAAQRRADLGCDDLASLPTALQQGGFCRMITPAPAPRTQDGRTPAGTYLAFVTVAGGNCNAVLDEYAPGSGINGKHTWVAVYAAPADPADDPLASPPRAWCAR